MIFWFPRRSAGISELLHTCDSVVTPHGWHAPHHIVCAVSRRIVCPPGSGPLLRFAAAKLPVVPLWKVIVGPRAGKLQPDPPRVRFFFAEPINIKDLVPCLSNLPSRFATRCCHFDHGVPCEARLVSGFRIAYHFIQTRVPADRSNLLFRTACLSKSPACGLA